jgi:hypothetical protein
MQRDLQRSRDDRVRFREFTEASCIRGLFFTIGL